MFHVRAEWLLLPTLHDREMPTKHGRKKCANMTEKGVCNKNVTEPRAPEHK
jgi:hypothetical protein